ncbi:hypothetical protein [Georgenia subflava]|uniref:DUF4280 domain-containing protein n=1 Tax=Georgenia subflava TaxID=1622177 RepID=A0A6N7EGQ8_9MICO|nr:hypothetical protein [Georgenia subflava]MPV37319.1 hypothetical protein [Georgenia subflava]
MAGSLVEQGATVTCPHQGQASPGAGSPRVSLDGAAAILLPTPWTVASCTLPPNSGGPCATASWTAGTTRVTSGGQPLVLSTGTSTCAPTAVPLQVTRAQQRVIAT